MGIDSFKTESGTTKGKNAPPSNKISKDNLIESLVRFHGEEEEKLTYDNFNSNKDYPSSRTIEKRFGSWNEGLKQAGVSLNRDINPIQVTDDMYEMSPEKAYILGVLMGDASINKIGAMGLSVVDREFAEQYAKMFCKWAGLRWEGFDSEETEVSCFMNRHNKKEHKDQYVIKKGVSEIKEHMLQYKYPNDYESILEEVKGNEVELIRGLWDSEGWIKKDGRVGFKNGHEETAVLYIEAITDVLQIPKEEMQIRETDTAFTVIIPNRYRTEFIQTIEPTIERKLSNPSKSRQSSKGNATKDSNLYHFKEK